MVQLSHGHVVWKVLAPSPTNQNAEAALEWGLISLHRLAPDDTVRLLGSFVGEISRHLWLLASPARDSTPPFITCFLSQKPFTLPQSATRALTCILGKSQRTLPSLDNNKPVPLRRLHGHHEPPCVLFYSILFHHAPSTVSTKCPTRALVPHFPWARTPPALLEHRSWENQMKERLHHDGHDSQTTFVSGLPIVSWKSAQQFNDATHCATQPITNMWSSSEQSLQTIP